MNTNTKHQPVSQSAQFLWLSVLLVLLAFVLRVVDVMSLPMFVDEGSHLIWVHQVIYEGNIAAGLINNKMLYPTILAIFRPLGPESVWLARSVGALFSMITVAACLQIGATLGDKRVGLLAGLFYVVLPMSVFHERQALVDPLLAVCTAVATLVMIRLARRPQVGLALIMGVALAAGQLTKTLALPYFALPGLAWLFWSWPSKKLRWKAAVWFVVSLALATGLNHAVRQWVVSMGSAVWDGYDSTISNTLLSEISNPAAQAQIRRNLIDYGDMLLRYFGPVIMALIAVSVIGALWGKRRWEIVFLFFPAFVFVGMPVLAKPVTSSFIMPPRYFLPNTAPMAVMAALGLSLLTSRWMRALNRPVWKPWIGLGLIALVVIPSLWFDLTLIRDPLKVPLTVVDVEQYHDRHGGYGRVEMAQSILAIHEADPETRLEVLGNGINLHWVITNVGPRVTGVEPLDLEDEAQRGRVAIWLAQGHRVFFIEEPEQDGFLPEHPFDANLTLIEDHRSEMAEYRIWEITGAGGELADEIYGVLATDPEFMGADYDALAASLTPGSTVVVYPAIHAWMLADRTDNEVIPLLGDIWPVTPENVGKTLAEVSADVGDGSNVEVIVVNESQTDPHRILNLALNERFFRLGNGWYGLLHHQRFVSGPTDLAWTPVNAVFEDTIHLEDAVILDSTPQPSTTTRFALRWQTDVEVQDSFRVFVHIMDEGGELRAQYDSEPGGGLLPMTAWQPGEVITDRFAIQLPADLPAGNYQVRIGLYHPMHGLRLQVTNGGEASDYVVVGSLAVQ